VRGFGSDKRDYRKQWPNIQVNANRRFWSVRYIEGPPCFGFAGNRPRADHIAVPAVSEIRRRNNMSSFRRYTNLAATIHLLSTRKITLLNPATWDDKNDAYYMAEYKRYKKAATVLALCFAEAPETYHHWKIFSHGSDGVCIEFDKDRLLSTFTMAHKIRTGYVKYKRIDRLESTRHINVEHLPFLKRLPYRDEREFRVAYVDAKQAVEYQDYPIKIRWIKRIILSPWMSKALSKSVKNILRSIDGCSSLTITRSTLVENERWKNITARVRP
jgi:hypothetical protein